MVETKQWEKDQESLKRWRDRRNNADAIKKYRTRLKKDVDELTGWVLHPNNKDVVKHIPEVLKSSVIPFLSSVDFTSKRQLRGGDAVQYQQRGYSHEVKYDDKNANRKEAQIAATGLAGEQNTAGCERTLLPATAAPLDSELTDNRRCVTRYRQFHSYEKSENGCT